MYTGFTLYIYYAFRYFPCCMPYKHRSDLWQAHLPKDLRPKLKALSKQEEKPMVKLITEAVEIYLKKRLK